MYGYSSYESCMEAAGAVVHNSQSFGSYQGDSVALVTYEGKSGFVVWSYGSCSVCDALESWQSGIQYPSGNYTDRHEVTPEQAIEFGKPYLEHIMTFEEAIDYAFKESTWSVEDAEMLEWVKGLEEDYKKLQ